MAERKASGRRDTKETRLAVEINLDGAGRFHGSIGVPFFEHMLNLMTRQALIDLEITGEGDVEIDAHHTVEDLGILLGEVFLEAVGDKVGIARYGSAYVPMDEALGFAAVDVSNRPFLVFDAQFPKARVGDFDIELVEEFMRAFAVNARLTLHLRLEAGTNLHHCAEALFKALGRALRQAIERDPRIQGVHSTKGVL